MRTDYGVLLDRVTNVGLLAAVVLFAYAVLNRPTSNLPALPSFGVGERAPLLTNDDYGVTDKTLILVLNSRCKYCNESMSFYRQLEEGRRQSNPPLRIVAVAANEPGERLDAFLKQHQLDIRRTSLTDESAWAKIRATPTLFLVGRDGFVKGVWIGRLTDDQRDHLRRALGLPAV
jgi:thioredoxin-related protein